MSSANKDVIYLDLDDEITTIIEKLHGAKSKIVAFVLPKRASVFQSIVNMKLLKRTADDTNKHIVLITSEPGILPLAGAVGVHVAKTLQSKPVIPPAPTAVSNLVVSDEESTDEDVQLDETKPIGELAGVPEETETIELDNSDEATSAAVVPKKPFNKKLKIPNFNKFRVRLFLGGAALILILIGWYIAAFVMPKAKILIKTDTSTLTTDVKFTAKTDATALDLENSVVPAKLSELSKTDNEKVAASGQKNTGDKAKGTMNLTNCINDAQSHTVPSGTSFSSGNFTFVTTEAVTLDPAVFSGNTCRSDDFGLDKDVPVIAVSPGDSYNLSARSYTSSISGIQASGSNMSGGTTKLVKVVAQSDIDNAKQKIQERANSAVAPELQQQLADQDYVGLADTLATGKTTVTSSPNVNEEATEVTVTLATIYTMVGMKKSDVSELIKHKAQDQIDPNQQVILKDGLDEAVFKVTEKKPNNETDLTLQTVVEAGPQLNESNLKKEIAGKKKGDAQKIIQSRPGVKDVTINYSPFWVYSTPSRTSKITIVIESANTNDVD